MPLNPKYVDCRQDRHKPFADVEVERNNNSLYLQSECVLCGAQLTAEVRWDGWEAVYKHDSFCKTCGEAAPHCDCSKEQS